jgi:hypothetical protein
VGCLGARPSRHGPRARICSDEDAIAADSWIDGALPAREFITLLGGAVAAWPFAARAQSGGVPVVGILHSASPTGVWLTLSGAFRQGLTQAGYSQGRNLTIEERWAEGQYDRLPAMAADLIRRWSF